MNVISAALDAHYQSEVTTLATCWKATLTNGTVFGFTSHTMDVIIGGVTYKAATGYTPTSIASNDNLAVDNLEVIGLLDSLAITESDLMAGLWDFATIEIFEFNYADLTMGVRKLRKGTLGEVKVGRQQFSAELRGLAQQLQQVIGRIYTPSCNADFGDARCGINLATYTVAGTVTLVTDQRSFADSARVEAAGYFEAGKLTWTSGNNNGLSMEVKTFSGGAFTLQLSMPYPVAVGDAYRVYAGCKKRFNEDCGLKFNNKVNFRGFPHVPSNDKLMQVGGK